MTMNSARWFLTALAIAAVPTLAAAQAPRVAVNPVPCLPIADHAVVTAEAANEPGGSTVRLYFRRLHHEVEDFYYLEMDPRGAGRYWAALPKPADEELAVKRLEDARSDEERANRRAAWWLAKERSEDRDPNDDLNDKVIAERAARGKERNRDWMLAMGLGELEAMLQQLDNEPADLFATLVDADGREIARSPMISTRVRENCPLSLTAQERGRSNNLVVGETADWQVGEKVFHWQCDGIVSRIGARGVMRADESCRACVIAAIPRGLLLLPAAAAVIGVTTDEPVSRVRP